MDERIKLFLNRIQGIDGYDAFEELVNDARPRVPIYDFRNSNVEEWKVKSGRQQGFDLIGRAYGIDGQGRGIIEQVIERTDTSSPSVDDLLANIAV